LLEDGGLDNLDGSSREKTQRYHVAASEDAGAPACDVLSTIAAERAAQQKESIQLTEEVVIGKLMCRQAYLRVRRITEVNLSYDPDIPLAPEAMCQYSRACSDEARESYDEAVWIDPEDPDEEQEEEKPIVPQPKRCDRCGLTSNLSKFKLKNWPEGGEGMKRCHTRPRGGKCIPLTVATAATDSATTIDSATATVSTVSTPAKRGKRHDSEVDVLPKPYIF